MNSLLIAANTSSGLEARGIHGKFLRDSYSILKRATTTSRLNYKPDCLSFALRSEKISDITALPSARETFEQICNEVAGNLRTRLSTSKRRYLNVMWSGGIDSTIAVVSLLKTWSQRDLRRVRILLSTGSIRESPKFYREHILPNFRGRLINSATTAYATLLKDSLVLTGELGDQIFGSDLIKVAGWAGESIGAVTRRNPRWRDLAVKLFSSGLSGSLSSGKRFLAVYEPIIRECPHPVDSLYMFLWWWNFSQKWQHVKYRILLFLDESTLVEDREHLVHFFDHPKLQRWAMDNPHLKIKDTWVSYKWTAKDVIVNYTRDQGYYAKEKRGSLYKASHFRPEKVLITHDCKFAPDVAPYIHRNFRY